MNVVQISKVLSTSLPSAQCIRQTPKNNGHKDSVVHGIPEKYNARHVQ